MTPSSTESLRKRIEHGRLLERSVRARNAELELCRRSCPYWLWNDQQYVWTKDEADLLKPVKPFPDDEVYRFILDEIHREPIIMLPKSRQIMATWLVCAYWLWWALFHPNQLLFAQSKKEEDAANLVFNKTKGQGRISFMFENLPAWMRVPVIESMGVMIFPHNGSKIWGIPQGSDIIRSYTASGLFSDEFAFQPFAEDAYKAAKPSAKKIVGVSSANPGFFARLCGFEKNDRSIAG